MKERKEIIQLLSADEPDYSSIKSKLTEEDYSIVNKLAKERSLAIATKAIICLGCYGSEKYMDTIVSAAKSKNPVLRLTAVQALGKMTGVAGNQEIVGLIEGLLDDQNIGVKKFALKTTATVNIASLTGKVQKISESDGNDHIKKLAQNVFEKLKIVNNKSTL